IGQNVHLVGELQGSGFVDRQWLVQRDGSYIQLTELLYRVVELIDGQRTLDEIAAAVTESTEWLITPENVQQIIQAKLQPLGLVARPGVYAERQSVTRRPSRVGSPFSVQVRVRIISPRFIEPFAARLQLLYAPPIFLPTVAVIAISHAWLYLVH